MGPPTPGRDRGPAKQGTLSAPPPHCSSSSTWPLTSRLLEDFRGYHGQ